jgi:hypothetical protein
LSYARYGRKRRSGENAKMVLEKAHCGVGEDESKHCLLDNMEGVKKGTSIAESDFE